MSNQSSIELLELPASIKTIMDSWSLQTGYPIVTVRRNYESQSAIVTQVRTIHSIIEILYKRNMVMQERFYLLSSRNTSADFPLWWIPLTYTTDFNATFAAWMMGTEDGIELELPSAETDWVIFNVDQVG